MNLAIAHLDEQQARRLKRWATAITLGLAIIGTVWAAAAAWSALRETSLAHARTLDDHETRIRSVETNTTEMRTDVRWIRQHLERRGRDD